MIEFNGLRITWDGAHNYRLERRVITREGQPSFHKDGSPKWEPYKYYGRHLTAALRAFRRELVTAGFNDCDTLADLERVIASAKELDLGQE